MSLSITYCWVWNVDSIWLLIHIQGWEQWHEVVAFVAHSHIHTTARRYHQVAGLNKKTCAWWQVHVNLFPNGLNFPSGTIDYQQTNWLNAPATPSNRTFIPASSPWILPNILTNESRWFIDDLVRPKTGFIGGSVDLKVQEPRQQKARTIHT